MCMNSVKNFKNNERDKEYKRDMSKIFHRSELLIRDNSFEICWIMCFEGANTCLSVLLFPDRWTITLCATNVGTENMKDRLINVSSDGHHSALTAAHGWRNGEKREVDESWLTTRFIPRGYCAVRKVTRHHIDGVKVTLTVRVS